MPADPEKVKEFRQAMRDIYKKLSPDEFFAVIKDKLVDFISKNPRVDSFELKKAIEDIFKPEYAKWTREINQTYNDVIDLINQLYSDLAGDLRRDLVKLERIEKVNRFKLGKYEEETIEHIRKSLEKSYKEELTYQETVKLIGKEDERARFYSRTIATTGMRAYARAGKNEKANIAEVFYFEYVGPLRIHSRPFCREMVGKTLHINEINKLGRAEVGQAFISPCILFCGGWNCGHDWEPDPFYNN